MSKVENDEISTETEELWTESSCRLAHIADIPARMHIFLSSLCYTQAAKEEAGEDVSDLWLTLRFTQSDLSGFLGVAASSQTKTVSIYKHTCSH